MQSGIEQILGYTAIPSLAIVLGGSVAVLRTPTPQVRSIVQHFAAGVVFSAVATELLPEITREHLLPPLIIGFLCGLGLMLTVNWLVTRGESDGNGAPDTTPAGLLAGVVVDVFVDGLLVGASFAAGPETGVLITLALTLELLFLGLAVSAALGRAGKATPYTLAVLLALALILLGGAALGGTLFAGLSGNELVAVLAFATAALLYLVTEELLVEAHDTPDTSLATAMFFVGFLALVVLDLSMF